jgi:hypothetical protein
MSNSNYHMRLDFESSGAVSVANGVDLTWGANVPDLAVLHKADKSKAERPTNELNHIE